MLPDVLGWYKRHWPCGELLVLGSQWQASLREWPAAGTVDRGSQEILPESERAGDRSIRTKVERFNLEFV